MFFRALFAILLITRLFLCEVTLEFLECDEFSLLNLLHARFDSFPFFRTNFEPLDLVFYQSSDEFPDLSCFSLSFLVTDCIDNSVFFCGDPQSYAF